jgi:hypothetical protein
MTWHPLALAVWLLEITAWAIYIGAAWRLLAVLPQWRPGTGDARQLWRERALELTDYQGRWAMALLSVSFVLVLVGLTNVWPPHVPGAMCGTGVLQAMEPFGRQTLVFRGLTLGAFYCWKVVRQLDGTRPEAVLARARARLLLLVLPLMAMGTYTFGQALAAVMPEAPVSCCAVLYDQARGNGGTSVLSEALLSDRAWVAASLCGALWVAAMGWRQWRRPLMAGQAEAAALAGATAVWVIAAAMHLKVGVAPYIYQVLWHPCPWCLFLGLHGAVGFVYFGLLAGVAAECAAALTARTVARRHDLLAAAARRRARRAGMLILAGALIFAALSAAPAVLWRLGSGGWIG